MPELGESVHEGTVSRWLKKVGDTVKEDEPIVEIMTDKVNTELPSPVSGVLTQILVQEGELVEVFHAMGIIEESGSQTESVSAPEQKMEPSGAPPAKQAASPASPAAAAPLAEGDRHWFTPVVRAMAKEHGLSDDQVASIAGSGSDGRVTKRDVEQYLAGSSVVSKPPKPVEAPAAPTTAGPDQEMVPLVGMRKMIADAMVRSSQVPTVSTTMQVDVSRMVEFRAANKDSFQSQFGVKLTYTPFFIKALTEALQEFPLVNASLQQDNQILMNRAVNMGIAVSLGKTGDEGLIVPVIRDTHKKSLVELARDLEEIAAKARGNGLKPTDVQGGTFTLTNPGSYGALFGTPMINAPQGAILGAYAITKVPVIVEDMIAIRSVMYLVLTYDHRLIDGLLAGRFLQSVRDKLQGFDFFK